MNAILTSRAAGDRRGRKGAGRTQHPGARSERSATRRAAIDVGRAPRRAGPWPPPGPAQPVGRISLTGRITEHSVSSSPDTSMFAAAFILNYRKIPLARVAGQNGKRIGCASRMSSPTQPRCMEAPTSRTIVYRYDNTGKRCIVIAS